MWTGGFGYHKRKMKEARQDRTRQRHTDPNSQTILGKT